jgi:hypothetical protein
MPVAPLGFEPFRALFPAPSRQLLFGLSCPPAVYYLGRSPASGLSSGRRSVPPTSVFQGWPGAAALLGFHSLQGLTTSRDGGPNGLLLSWASPLPAHCPGAGCPPEFSSAGAAAGLSRARPTLLGFLASAPTPLDKEWSAAGREPERASTAGARSPQVDRTPPPGIASVKGGPGLSHMRATLNGRSQAMERLAKRRGINASAGTPKTKRPLA